MSQKIYFKCDKLIRDKLEETCANIGVTLKTRPLSPEEYLLRLKDKVMEEVLEVMKAQNKMEIQEEIGDLMEVLRALGSLYGLSFEDIERKRLEKNQEKGNFLHRTYCSVIEMDKDNPKNSYYRADPERYPEIFMDIESQ